MTRIEAEAAIMEKLREIDEILHEYVPDHNYLSMTILDGHRSFGNRYWALPKNQMLDAFENPSNGLPFISMAHPGRGEDEDAED